MEIIMEIYLIFCGVLAIFSICCKAVEEHAKNDEKRCRSRIRYSNLSRLLLRIDTGKVGILEVEEARKNIEQLQEEEKRHRHDAWTLEDWANWLWWAIFLPLGLAPLGGLVYYWYIQEISFRFAMIGLGGLILVGSMMIAMICYGITLLCIRDPVAKILQQLVAKL